MKRFLIPLLSLFFVAPLWSYGIDEYPYESKYDPLFSKLNDVTTITNALDDKEWDMVYSALKRVGQLGIVSAREKVLGLMSSANPQANLGKPIQRANMQNIFYMSVLVVGKIGNTNDGPTLAAFLRDVKDPIGIVCVLQALGDMTNSKQALESLNTYTQTIHGKTDNRIVKQLVESIMAHNSKSSVVPLLRLQSNVDADMRDMINEAIKRISKFGRAA